MALWWGEVAQVQFVLECQSCIDLIPEGLYVLSVNKPLYSFIHDKG
jgi:hypothetical protein